MPYDICDDEQTLDLIESEMAARGITQEMIDERRQQPEREMLNDMKILHQRGLPLDQRNSIDKSTFVSFFWRRGGDKYTSLRERRLSSVQRIHRKL